MVRKRDQTLRRKTFERDNFTCKKCGLRDENMIKIEAHHIKPLFYGGKNDINNMITLCFDCHHFTPNSKEEFEEYIKEEMDGTSTTLLKAWNKVRKEHPELFEEPNKEIKKITSPIDILFC